MGINRRVRRRDVFTTLAAENSALRTENRVLYNLLETCKDWLKIMRADLSKISRVEGTLRAFRRAQFYGQVGVLGHGEQEAKRAGV